MIEEKSLFVSTYDNKYGSGIAMRRLADSKRVNGCDIEVLDESFFSENDFFDLISKKLRTFLAKFVIREKTSIYTGIFNIPNRRRTHKLINIIRREKYNKVYLHWIGHMHLDFNLLNKCGINFNVVHHDMWMFTGGCNYDFSCTERGNLCKKCPLYKLPLISNIQMKNKLNFINNDRTKNIFVSDWLRNQAKVSNSVTNYNCLPSDMMPVRESQNFQNYKHILFYAAAFKTDFRKGFELFKKLILELKSNNALKDFKVITAGDVDTEISDINIPRIKDLNHLRDIVKDVKFSVLPSHQEAFGQTALELSSLGVPVIVPRASGLSEIVQPLDSVLCYEAQNQRDLMAVVLNLVEMEDREYVALVNGLTSHVRSVFSAHTIAGSYLNL